MEDIISVIIPVYNVEQYLQQCMRSVLDQNDVHLEMLLVDDGSTDHSGEICDRFAQSDARVKVFHQNNKGAASAKNTALRMASGKYLAFADSDDYVEPGAYKLLLDKINAHKADVVQGSFCDVFQNRIEKHIILDEETVFHTEDYLKRYTIDWTCGLLWDKLYKRELFNGIFFEEGHIVDDEFFTYKGIMNAKKIVHIPDIVYNYRKRKSSVTALGENQVRTIYDRLEYLQTRRKEIAARFPELKQDFDLQYLEMLLWLSEDKFATIEVVDTIKTMLEDYTNNDKCKIPLRVKRKIHLLRHSSSESWLNARKTDAGDLDLSEYFD